MVILPLTLNRLFLNNNCQNLVCHKNFHKECYKNQNDICFKGAQKTAKVEIFWQGDVIYAKDFQIEVNLFVIIFFCFKFFYKFYYKTLNHFWILQRNCIEIYETKDLTNKINEIQLAEIKCIINDSVVHCDKKCYILKNLAPNAKFHIQTNENTYFHCELKTSNQLSDYDESVSNFYETLSFIFLPFKSRLFWIYNLLNCNFKLFYRG